MLASMRAVNSVLPTRGNSAATLPPAARISRTCAGNKLADGGSARRAAGGGEPGEDEDGAVDAGDRGAEVSEGDEEVLGLLPPSIFKVWVVPTQIQVIEGSEVSGNVRDEYVERKLRLRQQ